FVFFSCTLKSSSRSCWPLCTVGVSVSCLIRLLCGVSSMWPLLVFPGSESGSGSGSSDRSSVLVGSPVSLPCVFERRTEPLDRGALTVEWNVVDRRGDKSIVYTFEDGGARPSRGDCAVDARRLLLGDASLLLHNVTVADEGLYTCRVITPLVHSQTAALEVWVSAARPSVSLPERVEVTDGEERTIQCAVSAYYPEKLAVTWHVANGSHTLGAGLGRSARVCTELATRNPDGTFSIRSGVTLHSSAVAGGGIRLVCRVEHQTYRPAFSRAVTVTVRGEAMPYPLIWLTSRVFPCSSTPASLQCWLSGRRLVGPRLAAGLRSDGRRLSALQALWQR
uniref:Ig-like domain-containing protein n=1 Tax=Salarias fasciatus TaxID=181472 RepID=A0A672ITG9_SALFA